MTGHCLYTQRIHHCWRNVGGRGHSATI